MTISNPDFAPPILAAATLVAKSVSARAILAYVDALDDPGAFKKTVKSPTELILVCRDPSDHQHAKSLDVRHFGVPDFDLTRMGQIKMATLIAFSQALLRPKDVFVFLTGLAGQHVDTLVAMQVGHEYELFQSVGQPKLTEHIRRPVFERVLTICLELAHQGREGKPVGALFVIGDHQEVQKCGSEGRINPFKGYPEKQRNIQDDSIKDTVKELAKLDGAFILKGNGVILSAGTNLHPTMAGEQLPQGLGARHAAAAAITASTKSISISLSESTGTVRVWRRGVMITEIEKSSRSGDVSSLRSMEG